MKENILYLECYSGISGDMTVASLLDLGADQNVLLNGLNSLKVSGYRIEIGRRPKNSIDACDFNVILDSSDIDHAHDHNHSHNHMETQNHNHKHSYHLDHEHSHNHDNSHHFDHEHSHNHDHNHHLDHEHSNNHDHSHHLDHEHNHNHSHHLDHDHSHDHTHDDHHTHNHDHDHTHSHTTSALDSNTDSHLVLGHHEHRNLFEINDIIEQSGITEHAKTIAKKIFHIVAVAEAKAHAKPIDQVHFHEVGAVDSIVDIVATAICLDNLNIKQVIVSELHEGTGQIRCQHGILPIPVPAVVNIAAEHQLSLHITEVKGELVTPTGAAIVAAIKTGDTLPKEMKIIKIGLGAGKRNYAQASGILRAMLIEDITSETNKINTPSIPINSMDKVWVLEANIDDCSGEALSYTMELLFQNGARDVYYTPIFMKKNRPAYLLGVICEEGNVPVLESIIFTNTTTIGIRRTESIRTILPREQITVKTAYGEAKVKLCAYQNKTYIYPEYESVKLLCQKSGMDYLSMYQHIRNAVQEML